MRLSFYSIAYIFALIPSVTPKYADPEDLGLYYDAKLNADNKTATITLSGNFTDSKTPVRGGVFAQVADDAYDGRLTYSCSRFQYDYKNAVVVFVRPLIAAQTPIVLNTEPPMVPMNLTTRNYTYLYALGKHTDRGVTYNVTLFSDASGVGVTHLAQAATSTSSAFSPFPALH
ncbi:hypothetical protein BCR33DRAFT_717687 [Rhizoclosmatium globosum]|uniref:Uncharacterized protein n=1 Tax=Rhizoclosmatium globosum TaxID=329046 RepID=A0A1Y2C8W8_9FUNG|nr:hypothetical protein BCR33DRAFT_717687 [Rhizoclosmatium globosum]|eukprot:ORY43483.1 hypothetical protein BCR33DRAFT_717687 [Rhizoclosmatium globosum]